MKSLKKFDYGIMFFLLFLSVFLSKKSYPFIGTADGFKRLWIAAHSEIESTFSVLPPLQSYIFRAFLFMTGDIWFYTILQSFLFYLCTYISIKFIFRNSLTAISSLILLISFPVFSIFPLILTDSSIIYAFIAIFPALVCFCNNNIGAKKYLGYAILFFVTTAIFGFRFNAVIVAPVMLCVIFLYHKQKLYIPLSIILASIVFTSLINKDVRKDYKPEALGMAWELVSLARNNPNEEFIHKLDFCGDTKAALTRFNPMALNSIFWDANPPLPVECIVSNEGSEKVKQSYSLAWKNNFSEIFKVKLGMWSNIFGISQPLMQIEHGINSVEKNAIEWGAKDNEDNTQIRYYFSKAGNETRNITLRPVVSFVLLGMSILLILFFNKKAFIPTVIMSSFSLFYYCGFMISAQSMEFRYFAPSFFINCLITVSSIVYISGHLMKKKTLKHQSV